MFRNIRGGLSRSSDLSSVTLPQYSIPNDLEKVLNVTEVSEMSKISQMYSIILESLTKVKYVDLSESHYVQLLKLALYLEEYRSNEEMKKRKLFKQKIRRENSRNKDEILFKIRVKDLDEERPWIREGDFVDVIDTKTYRSFTLKVTNATKTDIIASDDAKRLVKVFKSWHLYNINFRFQNYPLRCNHWALWLSYKESVITYLFPDKSKAFIKMENKTHGELWMINPNIESNPEQKQAVLNIVNKSSFPAPYILYGPPGTGKTATLVEAIYQICKSSEVNHILVCTPSNTAADEIAKRLLKYVSGEYIYRIYSQSKNRSSIDEELKNYSHCGGGEKNSLTRIHIAGKRILITTLCTATRFLLMQLKSTYFSHIIIDEAGQGTEADILIPVSVASEDGKLHSQIVLAGDPQQLGPTVISKLADKILGRSILERLMSYDTYQKDCNNTYNPKYITKLLHNYRSHPNIIHISNKLFYSNELISKVLIDDKIKTFPVIFHGVEGIEEKSSNSTSTLNNKEIGIVMKYVEDLIDNKTEFGEVSSKDIGIVTPFTLQSKRIKRLLKIKDDEEQRKIKDETLKDVKILEHGDSDGATSTDVKTENDESDQDNKNEKIEGKDEKTVFESENIRDDVEAETDDAKIKIKNREVLDLKDRNVIENENRKDNFEVKTENNKKNLQSQDGKDIEVKAEVDDENQIKRRNFRDINVGTVELFQGQERKIMIMTAVRSKIFAHDGKKHIGFLSHPKRFNVAMSRAQDVLIVIGNPGILQTDYMWHYLLKYCMDNGSYRGYEFELQDLQDDEPDIKASQSIASSTSFFKESPFKLFMLDETDSGYFDLLKTAKVFVSVEEVEDRAERKFLDAFQYDFKL